MSAPPWSLQWLGRIPSTNDHVKELARRGAPGGTVVVARAQDRGRGRGTHGWSSPEGGLYLSLLLRNVPQPLEPFLAFAAGEALVRTVGSLRFRSRVWLKWPNDLLAAPADADEPVGKVAGILIESVSRGSRLDHAVVGVGLNLQSDPRDLPTGIDPPAVSFKQLEPQVPDADLFVDVFLGHMHEVLDVYAADPRRLVQQVQHRLAWSGERVRGTLAGGERVEGVLLGLTTDGALRLETSAGERALDAWDVRDLARV